MSWLEAVKSKVARENTYGLIFDILSLIPTKYLLGKNYYHYLKIANMGKSDSFCYRKNQTRILFGIENYVGYTSIARFPIMDRDIYAEKLSLHARKLPRGTRIVTTSGSSTGRPASVIHDAGVSSRELAYVHWAWEIAGYDFKMRKASIRGFHFGGDSKWIRPLNELRISCLRMDENYGMRALDLVEKYKCEVITSYPSVLKVIIKAALEKDRKLPQIKCIMPISEPVRNDDILNYKTIFPNAKIAILYGMTEKVALARSSDGVEYQVAPTYGLVEILDERGNRAQLGEIGRVVATGLFNYTLPQLRYDTGDKAKVIEFDEEGFVSKFANVVPRRNNIILEGFSGSKVSFSALNVHSLSQSEILDFCVIHTKIGELEIQIVPHPKFPKSAEKFFDEFLARLPEDFKIQKRIGSFLPRVASQKNLVAYKDFD